MELLQLRLVALAVRTRGFHIPGPMSRPNDMIASQVNSIGAWRERR